MMSLMGDRKREVEMFLCDTSGFPELRIPVPHNEELKPPPCRDSLGAEIWIVGCFLPDYSSRLLITQLWVCFLCIL